MNATYRGLYVLAPPARGPPSNTPPSTRPTSPTALGGHTRSISIATVDNRSYSGSGRSGSTVWGPGALTGKLLKWVGENVERGAEYMIISNKLRRFERMQPELLNPTRTLSPEERSELEYQTRKLVELCIIGLRYPSALMTRAFMLVLNGFKLPGRQTWTLHIAKAISEREIVEVYDIFYEGFFSLLDDSIFRLNAFIDHETLCFRCPIVSHEIANIISYLARKDRSLVRVQTGITLSRVPSNTTSSTAVPNLHPTFTHAIIKAGFFRLVRRWSQHGHPHWDQRGIECLENTLNYVADAQEYHGDMATAAEARDLMRKLQARRLLVDLQEVPKSDGFAGRLLGDLQEEVLQDDGFAVKDIP